MKNSFSIPDYVRNALDIVAQKLGFVPDQYSVDYDFRPGADNRTVVSVFYRVTFREEPREVTVLCKVPPPEADETMVALFEREAFVYGKLLPAFEQFQRSHWEATTEHTSDGHGEETVISFGPLCHHAHCDAKKGEGIIILEDVRRHGFSNRHKFEPLDYDHARLAMVQLGRFHAISLALKKRQPELFEQYRHMGEVTGERALSMEGFEQAMEQAFESASATFNSSDVGRREKLARLRSCFVEELRNISDITLSEPFCVVCHGDFAGDNMMFSYNIQSIDEETSRVIVKFAIGGATESLNEYMIQLVSKEEYNKYSKYLNTAKYEEFKNRELANNTERKTSEREKPSREARDEKKHRSPSPNDKKSRDRERYDRQSERSPIDNDRRREGSDRPRQRHDRPVERVERRHQSRSESSNDDGGGDHSRSDSEDDERRKRSHKKSSSSYVRTSSGTKKKSHKYKQRRRQYTDSESDDKHHKKKTKKSKKPRSRSRSRR